jgi:hypothetical protein
MNAADIVNQSEASKSGNVSDQEQASPKFVIYSIIGMIGLLAFVHFGFSKTYIRYFPNFEPANIEGYGYVPFNWIMHFHGMMMMGWVLMLLVQPILIRTGRKDLHRKVGKLSYVLAPLVVVGIYLANVDAYQQALATFTKAEAIQGISVTFPGLIFFPILYILAMYYRHQPALHMRFMCSTAFLLISPALDRILMTWFGLPGFDIGCYIVLTLIGVFVLVDSMKTKKLSPFFLMFCFFLLHTILFKTSASDFWQTVGGAISKIF